MDLWQVYSKYIADQYKVPHTRESLHSPGKFRFTFGASMSQCMKPMVYSKLCGLHDLHEITAPAHWSSFVADVFACGYCILTRMSCITG